MRDYLKTQLELKESDKIEQVTLGKYLSVPGNKEEVTLQTDRIAILFAAGDIVDGKGDDSNVGAEKYIKQLRKLREDEKVKAIVFRVNSPGGSALASDVIAREVALTVAKNLLLFPWVITRLQVDIILPPMHQRLLHSPIPSPVPLVFLESFRICKSCLKTNWESPSMELRQANIRILRCVQAHASR